MSDSRGRAAAVLKILALITVVIAGLVAGRPLLVPLCLAVFLATISTPALRFLRSRRVPDLLAIPLVILALALVLVALALALAEGTQELVGQWPRYSQRLAVLRDAALITLDEYHIPWEAKPEAPLVDPATIASFAGTALGGLATFLADAAIVVIVVLFILAEADRFPAKLRRALGDSTADLSRYQRIVSEVMSYLQVKSLMSLLTAVAVGVFLAVLDVDGAQTWAILTLLLNFIPNIGAIVAAVPPVAVALLQRGSGAAALAATGLLIINVVIGSIVEPQIMGKRMGLSTLTVLLSLIVWGWIWGPAGMLLSVPLTMTLKIAFENDPSVTWIARLMEPPPESLPTTAAGVLWEKVRSASRFPLARSGPPSAPKSTEGWHEPQGSQPTTDSTQGQTVRSRVHVAVPKPPSSADDSEPS